MIWRILSRAGLPKGAVLTLLLSLVGVSVCWGVDQGTEITEQRIQRIEDLTEGVLAEVGLEADRQTVTDRVTEAFFEAEPDCPRGDLADPVSRAQCLQAARELTQRVVNDKFGELDLAALREEARETYPVYEIGEIVDVVFQLNPARRERVRGALSGRGTGALQVGRWQIMFEDLVSVDGDDENPALKFDMGRSRELREQFVNEKIEAFETKRNEYREAAMVVARRERFRIGARTNEERGYLFWEDEWLPVAEAVGSIVADLWDQKLEERRRERMARVEALKEDAADAVAAETAGQALAPNSVNVDPRKTYDALMASVEKERARREAAQSARDQAEEEAEQTAKDPVAEVLPEPGAGEAGVQEDGSGGDQAEAAPGTFPWAFLIVAVAVAMVAIAGTVFYARQRTRAPSAFFKGKGRMQKSFWAKAEADPEHFNYVAYIFPTMDEARDAIAELSFIHETPDGQLNCPHDIMFGVYPHQGKAVCFVGGNDLHYALWREASAVMPELPGAEYFRVSSAPDVQLEIPDIEAILHDEELQITHVENREGQGDDYSQYYVYRAPDRENALEFLQRANIDEAGIHVIVETPEGVWGKDQNGIYQE